MDRINLIQGDITKLQVDAIVNAANSSLLGGGGVDGAIHRAAGSELVHECRLLGGCKTGQAKLTKGYLLPAKFIIHTVGPVWNEGKEEEMKASHSNCYANSLKIAEDKEFRTIAFPNISTGIYRFPKGLAAQIAISTVKEFLSTNNSVEQVTFVCFDVENYHLYAQILEDGF